MTSTQNENQMSVSRCMMMCRGSENVKQMCNMCADMCEACATECDKMADKIDACKQCADACRKCAQECRNMMR